MRGIVPIFRHVHGACPEVFSLQAFLPGVCLVLSVVQQGLKPECSRERFSGSLAPVHLCSVHACICCRSCSFTCMPSVKWNALVVGLGCPAKRLDISLKLAAD